MTPLGIESVKMIKKLLIILAFILFAPLGQAATYNYYFANSGSGGSDSNTCLTGDPCATISKVNSMIAAANSDDIVYIYFNRGDLWDTCDTDDLSGSAACIDVYSSDPTVHFNAYGSGNKPKFDGLEDFSGGLSTPDDNCVGAPCRYSKYFFIHTKNNSSIQNLEIYNVYGRAIHFRDSDDVIIRNNKTYNLGGYGIIITQGCDDATIEYNDVHLGQRLYEPTIDAYNSWGQGISTVNTAGDVNLRPVVQYNLVYDIYGECVAADGTIKYNVIGDCGSTSIDIGPQDYDAADVEVAYNLIIHSQRSSSIYDSHSGGVKTGIRLYDEEADALDTNDNSDAEIDIYGNIIINRGRAIRLWCIENPPNSECETFGDGAGHIYIYNNIFIDNWIENIGLYNTAYFENVKIYNNASILYNRTGSDHTNSFSEGTNWDIDNNLIYTNGGTEACGGSDNSGDWDCDFNANVQTTDPDLPGEPTFDWTNQTGTYWYSVDITNHLYPPPDSPLVNNGKELNSPYATSFLTTGNDFDDVLTGSIGSLSSENNSIGAVVRSTSGDQTAAIQGAIISGGYIN